ncbi:MAG: hypothetical protein IPI05_05315 [Flavobacteriales bacterium]|nr:hypothetical protein [Flavobacteriales bacterium]
MFLHTSPETDLQGMFLRPTTPWSWSAAPRKTDMTVGIDDPRELGVHVILNPVRNGMLNITGIDGCVITIEVP